MRSLHTQWSENVTDVNKIYDDEKGVTLKESEWTMVHGFYAGMGGFVIDLDDDDISKDNLVPGHTPRRLTLTPRGVLLLAQCGLLPRLTKDEIKDKSKADSIAKTLVLLQAGWLIVQLIGRVAQKLPVTLLEVNTLGHVVCAFIIYMMWWHKPRQVETPTRLHGEQIKSIASYMLISSSASGWKPVKNGLLQDAILVPELSVLAYFRARRPAMNESAIGSTRDDDGEILGCTSESSQTSTAESASYGHFGPRPVEEVKEKIQAQSDIIEQAHAPTTLQETHWGLASQAYDQSTAIRERFESKGVTEIDGVQYDWYKPKIEELVLPSMGNWPDKSLLNKEETLVMSTVIWFASVLYGAVHIAAWNDHFPSTLEAWLWRSSACFIAWSGAVWIIANSLTDRSKTIYNCWIRILSGESHWYSYGMLGTAVVVCGTSYLFARAYLVVEAFISMRSLPPAAYDTPDWDRYIPHF